MMAVANFSATYLHFYQTARRHSYLGIGSLENATFWISSVKLLQKIWENEIFPPKINLRFKIIDSVRCFENSLESNKRGHICFLKKPRVFKNNT